MSTSGVTLASSHNSIPALPALTSPLSSKTAEIFSSTISQLESVSKMECQVRRPMGIYVGELQERWNFSSDHLPIAMTYEDVNFVSWNVLNAEYMSWVIEKNTQGLSRSKIADEHIYIGDSKLTIRDKHNVGLILQMITHPTHPRRIIALQECSKPFIKELRSQIPAHFEIIVNHGDAILVDQRHIEILKTKEVSGIFAHAPDKILQDVTVRRLDSGQLLRLVNIHLPCDPTKPCRFEFAKFLYDTFDPKLATIVMGDMNYNELEMLGALKQAFKMDLPFALYAPYCTNISPDVLKSKAIDHFFVYSPSRSVAIVNLPDQIMPSLSQMVSLLENGISKNER